LWGLSGNRSASSIYEGGVELEAQPGIRAPAGQKGPSSKTKFTCADCGQNAWGKPDLAILCEPCGIEMVASVRG
jgi:ribosomal protein S27E